MEEERAGSATEAPVRFLVEPTINESNRGTNSLRIQWLTDVDADSRVEFAVDYPPYSRSSFDARLVRTHGLTLSNLQPHTLYHYRVSSAAPGRRAGVSRDFVICTRPMATNLLLNPGFEEGSGASPRSVVPGWNKSGNLDARASDGTWFGSLPRHGGAWFLQGALNGGSSDGVVFQRVSGTTPGLEYTFSAWVTTWPMENGTWKYDVWNAQGRLIYMRLGLDPTGGTNVAAATVQWTPRMYSHRHYSNLAKAAVAQSSNLTVFVSMKGDGVQWHLYGIDDAVLSHEEIPARFESPSMGPDGVFRSTLYGRAHRTNVVEASVDFRDWVAVTNLVNPGGESLFEDRWMPEGRFYRTRTLP
jgi:hypothetical protein